MKNLVENLSRIQKELKAPKNQLNKFGGYKYRSCEDIMEALKPFLGDLAVTLSDSMEAIGDRIYVKATARITDGTNSIDVCAYARESQTRKGMDDSQLTGSTSSYARKYALNGLFLIDDNRDADSQPESESGKLKLTALDIQWINACKMDPEVLNQINDPSYKKFIQSKI